MEIKTKITTRSGVFDVIYAEEKDPTKDLDGIILHGVHAYCFYADKLVIVYAEKKGYWTPPGGAIELGETWKEATIREIKEETNMKVLHIELIGYQDVYQKTETVRQTRAFCIVEPLGDFISDPDEDITEVKLIDPRDYKKYLKWGEIGDRLMEQALELKQKYEKSK